MLSPLKSTFAASSASAVMASIMSRKWVSCAGDKSLDRCSILLISCLVGKRIVKFSSFKRFLRSMTTDLQYACQVFVLRH